MNSLHADCCLHVQQCLPRSGHKATFIRRIEKGGSSKEEGLRLNYCPIAACHLLVIPIMVSLIMPAGLSFFVAGSVTLSGLACILTSKRSRKDLNWIWIGSRLHLDCIDIALHPKLSKIRLRRGHHYIRRLTIHMLLPYDRWHHC